MHKFSWAERLGRWLPAGAERDLYRPSLADLRCAPPDRWFAVRVLAIFIECLWLACLEWLVAIVHSGRRGRPRREVLVMFQQDVRRAFRLFRLEPGFAAAAVLTLALGVGANTALFAVVEAVLLRPLPYPGADELVIVKHRDRATGISKEFIAMGDFLDLRARQQSLEGLVGYGGFQATLIGDGEPLRVDGLSAHA